MVEPERFYSRDKALIPLPGSSKSFSADFQGILLCERNQIVSYVAFFQSQPRSLHRNSPVHA